MVRAAKTWNEIPDRVKGQRTINGFKNAYDAWKRMEQSNFPENAAVNDEGRMDTQEIANRTTVDIGL